MSVVRWARRVGVVSAAVAGVGGLGYAGIVAVSNTEDAERRIDGLEAREGQRVDRDEETSRDLRRLEGKVDALMRFLRVPPPEGP